MSLVVIGLLRPLPAPWLIITHYCHSANSHTHRILILRPNVQAIFYCTAATAASLVKLLGAHFPVTSLNGLSSNWYSAQVKRREFIFALSGFYYNVERFCRKGASHTQRIKSRNLLLDFFGAMFSVGVAVRSTCGVLDGSEQSTFQEIYGKCIYYQEE